MEVDDRTENLLTALIISLQTEELQTKVATIQQITGEILPDVDITDVEPKIFQHVMPILHELFAERLFKIEVIFERGESTEDKDEAIVNLQECLTICIHMLTILETIIQYLEKCDQLQFSNMHSFALNAFQILFEVFRHCKQCDKMYKTYINLSNNILHVFKSCQQLNSQLIDILNQTIYGLADEESILKILEVMFDVTRILVGINIKTMVENCKAYISLVSKMSTTLNIHFDLTGQIEFFLEIINKQLKDTIEIEDTCAEKGSDNIKVCIFFVRASFKLFEVFFTNITKILHHVIDFLCSVYSYYVPILLQTTDTKSVNSVAQVLEICDTFLEKLIKVEEVYDGLDLYIKKNTTTGIVVLTSRILEKVCLTMHVDNIEQICYLVQVSVEALSKNANEMFWPASVSTLSIYDSFLINLTILICHIKPDDYKTIEALLYNNIHCSNIWISLLISDIWYLTLRESSKELVLATLIFLIESNIFFMCTNPKALVIENFLKRLYLLLSDNEKHIIIEKYSPISHISVWKIFGFELLPKSQESIIQYLAEDCCEKIKELTIGDATSDNFKYLVDCLQALSKVSNKFDFDKQFTLIFSNLLDCNFECDDSRPAYTLLRILVQRFLQFSSCFLPTHNESIIQYIVKQLPTIIEVSSGAVLNLLSKCSNNNSRMNIHKIITISQQKPVIQINLLEIFELDWQDIYPERSISSDSSFNWRCMTNHLNSRNPKRNTHKCFKQISDIGNSYDARRVEQILNRIRTDVESLTQDNVYHRRQEVVHIVNLLQKLF